MAKVTYFDAMMRHQLMLERVKGFYYREFNSVLKKLEREVKSSLKGQGNLGELKKGELRLVIKDLNAKQAAIWQAWNEDILSRLQSLLRVDRKLAASILAATQGEAGRRLTASAFLDRAQGEQPLWASIRATPLGATGQTLEEMLAHFISQASNRITNEVAKGYANNLEANEVVKLIVGASGQNDGLFKTLRVQSRAVVATTFQHVSTETHKSVQSASYETYRWVSVLDDRTTDICRHRNGKIFIYGKGPMPPAHFHCRSTIVPAITGSTPQEETNNADEWLAQQLAQTVLGVLGTRLHNTREAIATSHLRPLTISQLANSANIITRDN